MKITGQWIYLKKNKHRVQIFVHGVSYNNQYNLEGHKMSFENAKNKLLGKWNKKYDINLNDYISGGIQDESSWLGSDFKVMYLVKDVNDCGNDFDKNKYFKDPDSSEMINTIIYWQKAINEARSNNYILGDRTLSWYKDLDLSVFDSLSIDEKKSC